MASSGSVDFTVTRDNLIADALGMVGAVGPADTPAAGLVTHAARQLNIVAKGLMSLGCSLWARKTGYILPQSGTNEIDLGPSGDHATLSYVQTTLSAAAASGASSITVASATGISASDYIGVEQTDGTIHWTTVNGAPSGSTITLTAVTTAAADSGDFVWTYTTKLQRPIKILEAFARTETAETDVPMEVLAKSQYDLLGAKTAEGLPNQIAYDPHLVDGRAYIYPRFSDGRSAIVIVFQRPFEDFDAAGDTPDFPVEWYQPLLYGLAVLLAPTYGLPVQDRRELRGEYQAALGLAMSNEPEEGSYFIQPDSR